jgi:hypothetical protein
VAAAGAGGGGGDGLGEAAVQSCVAALSGEARGLFNALRLHLATVCTALEADAATTRLLSGAALVSAALQRIDWYAHAALRAQTWLLEHSMFAAALAWYACAAALSWPLTGARRTAARLDQFMPRNMGVIMTHSSTVTMMLMPPTEACDSAAVTAGAYAPMSVPVSMHSATQTVSQRSKKDIGVPAATLAATRLTRPATVSTRPRSPGSLPIISRASAVSTASLCSA